LPDAKVRAILDETRWKCLDGIFIEAREWEPSLGADGRLEDAEPAGGANSGDSGD
jgi:hypothetical protein